MAYDILFYGGDRGHITEIYIWQNPPHVAKQRLLHFHDDGSIEWQEIEEEDFGIKLKPTLRLPYKVADELLLSCAREFNRQGKRLPDENKIVGLYEAQNMHLQDLRHLLKLPKEKTDER